MFLVENNQYFTKMLDGPFSMFVFRRHPLGGAIWGLKNLFFSLLFSKAGCKYYPSVKVILSCKYITTEILPKIRNIFNGN